MSDDNASDGYFDNSSKHVDIKDEKRFDEMNPIATGISKESKQLIQKNTTCKNLAEQHDTKSHVTIPLASVMLPEDETKKEELDDVKNEATESVQTKVEASSKVQKEETGDMIGISRRDMLSVKRKHKKPMPGLIPNEKLPLIMPEPSSESLHTSTTETQIMMPNHTVGTRMILHTPTFRTQMIWPNPTVVRTQMISQSPTFGTQNVLPNSTLGTQVILSNPTLGAQLPLGTRMISPTVGCQIMLPNVILGTQMLRPNPTAGTQLILPQQPRFGTQMIYAMPLPHTFNAIRKETLGPGNSSMTQGSQNTPFLSHPMGLTPSSSGNFQSVLDKSANPISAMIKKDFVQKAESSVTSSNVPTIIISDRDYHTKEEVCHLCSKEIRSYLKVTHNHIHELGKAETGLYACMLCDKVMPTYTDMFKHGHEAHLGKKWKCPHCGKEKGPREYKRIQQHKNKCFTSLCDLCGKVYRNKFELISHRETFHEYAPSICEICNHSFKNKRRLRRHKLRAHDKKVPCEYCEKEFRRNVFLRQHILTKHLPDEKKPFSCDTCGKGFGRKSGLKQHKAIHENLRLNRCHLCDHSTNSKSNLAKHRREKHGYEKIRRDGRDINEEDKIKLLQEVMEKDRV